MRFSVLMSVYFKEDPEFLKMAIDSVWTDQTSKPEQIVLVKDGPLTIELDNEICQWSVDLGDKLTVVDIAENVGLAAALNEGLQYCKNDLVARMDTDDVSTPDRFEKQVNFMKENPEIAVSSGQIEEWSQDFSRKISIRSLPLTHRDIVQFVKARSPISHPAAMFRKSAVLAAGGYPKIYPEDYQLWGTMIAKGNKFANLPDIILRMRVGDALQQRRGMKFLKGVVGSYKHLYSVGLINRFELAKNITFRAVVVLSPVWFKKILYKNFR